MATYSKNRWGNALLNIESEHRESIVNRHFDPTSRSELEFNVWFVNRTVASLVVEGIWGYEFDLYLLGRRILRHRQWHRDGLRFYRAGGTAFLRFYEPMGFGGNWKRRLERWLEARWYRVGRRLYGWLADKADEYELAREREWHDDFMADLERSDYYRLEE